MSKEGLNDNEAYKTALEMYKREHERWVQNALYLFGFFAGIFALSTEEANVFSRSWALFFAAVAGLITVCVALSIRASTDSWRDTLNEIEVYPADAKPFHIFARYQQGRSYGRDLRSVLFPLSAAELF